MSKPLTPAQRSDMKRIAKLTCGERYHIEFYMGPRYIRPQAVIVRHRDESLIGYILNDDGKWQLCAAMGKLEHEDKK